MILDDYVQTTWNVGNKDDFVSKGYKFTKLRDKIKVKISDLKENSNIKINCECDYCGNEFERSYYKILRGRSVIEKDACAKCKSLKTKESNIKKYGVGNVFELNETKEKSKSTNLEKYGVEHPSKLEVFKEKQKDTMIKKYGVTNPMYVKEFKDKIKETTLQNFGVEYGFNIKEVREKTLNSNTYKYETIKSFIYDNSKCELLTKRDEYINTLSIIVLKCECGNIFETTFINFKHENKRQCDECGIALRSGKNHPRYNGGLSSEDRIKSRDLPEYKSWRDNVYEYCDYTCQVCQDDSGGNLVAHHLNGWHWCEEERFKVYNGVTICKSCHKEFHNIYGYKDNTREQFVEFLINNIQQRENRSPASKMFDNINIK